MEKDCPGVTSGRKATGPTTRATLSQSLGFLAIEIKKLDISGLGKDKHPITSSYAKAPSKKRSDDILPACHSKTLGKHLADDVAMNVGQSSFESVMIKAQTLVIQAHQMKDRGIEIIN